jgi:methylmalonyl-CoA/ethylmalonyl-CoA epimerase
MLSALGLGWRRSGRGRAEARTCQEEMMALDTTAEHAMGQPGVRRIGQIAVPVHDLDRAVAFYRDVLGLRLLFQAPPGLAFFDCGGVRLMLSLPEGPDVARAASVIYYQVDDIVAAWAAVTARGATPEKAGQAEPHLIAKLPDHDLWMAFIQDSEGNLLGLMSEVRPPAP